MKTRVETIEVPVRVEIDKQLLVPCPVYYPKIAMPLKIDIEKALRIQRIIVKECSERLKAISEL